MLLELDQLDLKTVKNRTIIVAVGLLLGRRLIAFGAVLGPPLAHPRAPWPLRTGRVLRSGSRVLDTLMLSASRRHPNAGKADCG